jgi:hypothetical protein
MNELLQDPRAAVVAVIIAFNFVVLLAGLVALK